MLRVNDLVQKNFFEWKACLLATFLFFPSSFLSKLFSTLGESPETFRGAAAGVCLCIWPVKLTFLWQTPFLFLCVTQSYGDREGDGKACQNTNSSS